MGQTVPNSRLLADVVGSDDEEGKCMRRKGTVDRYACMTVDREKGLSERRRATVGYTAG